MDHLKVLRQAWQITWRYRVLWVFGVILGLTTARGGGNPGLQYTLSGEDFSWRGGEFPIPAISPGVVSTLIAIGIGLACMTVILSIAVVVARYVAETALIRMVDHYEATGEKRGVRQGFRLGWSRTALRLFLIDLVIGLPVALAFIVLFLLALAPLILWATDSTVAGVIGTVVTVGLVFLSVRLAIAVGVVLSLLMYFFRRACALEEMGVLDSIRHGYGIVRRHLKDAVVMWLIMFGLGLAFVIVMIPVGILVVIAGGVLGGLPALLVGWLASLTFEGAIPWLLAGVVGIPVFILVVAVPVLFLQGLMQVFQSSAWTLTYRELRALDGLETEPERLP